MMINKVQIIAEVKIKSPFGFRSNRTWEELFQIANKIGDIISIHTDPKFGGSFNLVKKAKNLTSKPILAKGLHADNKDIIRALEAGADYVLIVGRVPEVHIERCFIEPLNLNDLCKIPLSNLRVVWNSRDLSTGKPKPETFEQARKIWKGWLCQASYIRNLNDIKSGADAALIGTHLEEFAKSLGI